MNTDAIHFQPIGYFRSSSKAPYEVPRQGALNPGNQGIIELNRGCNYEQALEGLSGFDRIWVVFCFHRNSHWKPKVLPPRGGIKQGVFATRSPHRPNPIGLSCVELQSIQGLKLTITSHDLIDGTPVLDIKPYVNYADAFHCLRQGWVDDLQPELNIEIKWSPYAQAQCEYLKSQWNVSLGELVENRLRTSPMPYASNRVTQLSEGYYVLALRTWRIYYYLACEQLLIEKISSGYDAETMVGEKLSQWNDVPIHQAFLKQFPS